MKGRKEIKAVDKIVSITEKWAVFFLVLAPYYFLSFKIINGLNTPEPSLKNCGTGFFAPFPIQIVLTVVVAIILLMKLFKGIGYKLFTKIIITLLIIIPLVITLSFS